MLLSRSWWHVLGQPAPLPPPWNGGGTGTTLGNLGCVLLVGSSLRSESDLQRKQVSGKENPLTDLARWEESRLLFGDIPPYQLVTVTLAEAGHAYPNAFNSVDQILSTHSSNATQQALKGVGPQSLPSLVVLSPGPLYGGPTANGVDIFRSDGALGAACHEFAGWGPSSRAAPDAIWRPEATVRWSGKP